MKTLSNNGGGGFALYVYPRWSTIVGWCILICCIIPIPLVFIVNYFREYFLLRRQANAGLDKPRYLQAITENNSPRYDWGPKKKQNQFGLYEHLQRNQSNDELVTKSTRSFEKNTYFNETILLDDNGQDILVERF